MRIIRKTSLRDLASPYLNAHSGVETWIKIVESANWMSLADLQSTIHDVDQVKLRSGSTVTVFNICRNDFRLITAIHYNTGRVFIRDFLTHKAYDKEQWKRQN